MNIAQIFMTDGSIDVTLLHQVHQLGNNYNGVQYVSEQLIMIPQLWLEAIWHMIILNASY